MIKFAIVGCGRVSSLHFAAIEKAPDTMLAAVCDTDEAAAKKAAEENGLSTYYTNLEEMLRKEEIDVINICTPSGTHADVAVIAAAHKKHILCEKPLEVTSERMQRMIDACEENGVLLSGVFQRRNTDMVQIAKKTVAEGKLGKVILADAYLKYWRSQEYYDSGDWRGTWELDGGGCLMNQGIHGIDMLIYVAGRVKSVTAKCATLARDIAVEDTATVLLNFEHGGMGVIECATSVFPGQDTIISVHGTEGSISFGTSGFLSWQLPDGSEAPAVSNDMGGLNCAWAGNSLHAILVEDMAEAVRDGRKPLVDGKEARHAVDVILAIYESARTGKEVFIQ